MAKYITQELFDMCSVMALKIASGNSKTISNTSQLVASNYTDTYSDENLSSDIEIGAQNIKSFIEKNLPKGSMVANCTQLQFCIKEYNPDGSRKKKRLLGGTFFNYEKIPLPDKVGVCSRNIFVYHLNIMNGKIPIAPNSWSL